LPLAEEEGVVVRKGLSGVPDWDWQDMAGMVLAHLVFQAALLVETVVVASEA